jgi:hypothetical protein
LEIHISIGRILSNPRIGQFIFLLGGFYPIQELDNSYFYWEDFIQSKDWAIHISNGRILSNPRIGQFIFLMGEFYPIQGLDISHF